MSGAVHLQTLRKGYGSRPEVSLVRHNDRLLVTKDYGKGNTVLRLLGLLLLAREEGAYAHLRGVRGIPECPGRADRYTLVTEYVAGEPASTADPALLTPQFYARLEELVNTMHSRGVVHGDLKRLDNILITAAGEPVLIDFSAAFWHGSNPIAAIVFPHLWDDDLRAIYKLKARRTPELLTRQERQFLERRSLAERWFRSVREYFRRPVQRLAGSEPEATTPRP